MKATVADAAAAATCVIAGGHIGPQFSLVVLRDLLFTEVTIANGHCLKPKAQQTTFVISFSAFVVFTSGQHPE